MHPWLINLILTRTSEAKAGAEIARGTIEAIAFPRSIFIERAPAFIIERAAPLLTNALHDAIMARNKAKTDKRDILV